MGDLVVFVSIVALMVAAGIAVGMIVATRLDRIMTPSRLTSPPPGGAAEADGPEKTTAVAPAPAPTATAADTEAPATTSAAAPPTAAVGVPDTQEQHP